MPVRTRTSPENVCADRLHIPNGREIKFLVPLDQFRFISQQRCNLLLCEMKIEQCYRVMNKLFHFKNYTRSGARAAVLGGGDSSLSILIFRKMKEERPPTVAVFLIFIT